MNDSAVCNVAQLVTAEDGTIIVPTYNWTDLFAPHFSIFEKLKDYHHFSFDSSKPGVVTAKIRSDSKEVKEVKLLKDSWKPTPSRLPPQVMPKGLSTQRQWYLYDKIREFCPEEDSDVTCPMPTVPRVQATSRAGTPAVEDPAVTNDNEDDGAVLPPKKKRRCRTCKKEGHNARSCPDREQ